MASRLRQPGFGNGPPNPKHAGPGQRENSLPPILDRSGSHGAEGGGFGERRLPRSSSVGAKAHGQGGRGAFSRPEPEGRGDGALPPLPRRSASSAPEVRKPNDDFGGNRKAPPAVAAALDRGAHEDNGRFSRPERNERSSSRPPRQVAPLEGRPSEPMGTPPNQKSMRPPAVPQPRARSGAPAPFATADEPAAQQPPPRMQRQRSNSQSRRPPQSPGRGAEPMRSPAERDASPVPSPAAAPAKRTAPRQPEPRRPPVARAPARSPAPAPASPVAASTPRPASPPIASSMPTKAAGGAEQMAAKAAAEMAAEMEEQAEESSVQLFPCQMCGRKFNQNALERHKGVCKKVFCDKRKVYNTTEHRLPDASDAPELAEVRRKAAKAAAKGEVGIGDAKKDDTKQKKNNWRIKSEAFRQAMKSAQLVDQYKREGRDLRDLPPPPAVAAELDDRIQCVHCGRKFGEQQHERHIKSCAATKAKAKAPPGARGPPVAPKAAPKGAAKRR